MPPASKRKRPQNAEPSEHMKKKNFIQVSMEDIARCWCQGEGVGCGVTLARSTRYEHARNEETKRKDAELHELPPEFLAARNLMLERQALAASRNDGIGIEEPPGDEFGLLPEEPPIEMEDAGGGMVEDIVEDWAMEERIEGAVLDDPGPEVAVLFALETEGLGEVGEDAEVDKDIAGDEEEPQFEWDQALVEEDADFGGAAVRAVEDERREEMERLFAIYEREQMTESDIEDLKHLAYNLKHGHSCQALEDLSRMHNLSTPYIMNSKLEKFSGLKEEVYHCCINSCLLFVGPHATLERCPICLESCLDNRSKPRNIFRYLPLIPRLQAFFKSQRMIDLLGYREELGPFEGVMRGVFDSEHFRMLLDTLVTIDGVEYPHKIGSSKWDVFIGFTFDGVSLWRGLGSVKSRASVTCWPTGVIIYSLDPKLRTRNQFVFSLGMIPGPHSPKHVNSFLYPFYQECRQGAIGIPTFHSQLNHMFNMHLYPIFATMDMPALAKADGSKGAGSIIPCIKCPINGLRDVAKKNVTTYYLPHRHPDDPESQTDTLLANLTTHEYFENAWNKLSQAETVAEREKIQKDYGITCVPILGLLPSINLVKSFPFGAMHLLFENNAPNLVLHWKGEYKNLDSQGDPYALDEQTWTQIGLETAASVRTTPSSMNRATPDIHLYSSKFTAESWAFWITWLAPYLMRGRLPAAHYEHLLLFSDIIKLVTSLEITEEMLDRLEVNIKKWHADYEELYYRYEMGRISTCPLTLHALIHLHTDTRHAGPLSRIWEYVTERFMGEIARSVKSRRYPFSQLSNTVKRKEQMKMVMFKYGLEKELNFSRPRRDWTVLSNQETMMQEINDTTVLKSPMEKGYAWDDSDRKQAAIYFKQALNLTASAQKIAKKLPTEVFRWGKLRVRGEKNVIGSSWAKERDSDDRNRDSSFVRAELLVDENADDATLPDNPRQEVFYGQLQYVCHVTLRTSKSLKVKEDCSALLGVVRWCKGATGDASIRPVWYDKMGARQAVNVSTIQCVVGRVKVREQWGILDLNYGCASTTFVDDEGDGGASSDEE